MDRWLMHFKKKEPACGWDCFFNCGGLWVASILTKISQNEKMELEFCLSDVDLHITFVNRER